MATFPNATCGGALDGAGSNPTGCCPAIIDRFPKTDPAIRKATFDLIRSGYRFTTTERQGLAPDGKCHFVLRSQLGINARSDVPGGGKLTIVSSNASISAEQELFPAFPRGNLWS
jgi:hypothetical protein